MYHLVNNLTNKSGDALVGYYVKLKDADGNYATLFSDENETPIATVSGAANAGITDSNGMYDIYVADGTYDIEFFDKNDITLLVSRIPAVPMFSNTSVEAATEATLAELASTTPAKGAALVAFVQSGTGAVARSVEDKLLETVSVTDYGADPTGVVDSTDAFNLATQATAVWSSALECTILVPPGRYKVNGTVYVRKGQTIDFQDALIDASDNTDVIRFALGRGLIGGTPTDDAGGSPVKLRGLRSLGGSGNQGFITVYCQGFEIIDPFLTSPGVGIVYAAGAADGVVSGAIIDQALVGISATGCQNIVHTGFKMYLVATGIQIGSSARDLRFVGGVIAYSEIASFYCADAVTDIRNISLDGISFVSNAQDATFTGHIHTRAVSPEVRITGCTFRNWKDHAVNAAAGATPRLTFVGCEFNGTKSAAAYTQSTTAAVLYEATAGRFTFHGCTFANLLGEIAKITSNSTKLAITGGEVINCPQERFEITATGLPDIKVKDVDGFAYVSNDASNQAIVLPVWGNATGWRVRVKGNNQATSDADYSRVATFPVWATCSFPDGFKRSVVEAGTVEQPASAAAPTQLAPAVCFGTAPGGLTLKSYVAGADTICVSVPVATSDAANFTWDVETIA